MSRKSWIRSILCIVATLLCATAGAEDADDPLKALGLHVTGGAAPGYVDDRVCARCHLDVAKTYENMGMARSFYRAEPKHAIEDFSAEFYHGASQRHYSMELRDGRYVFRRHQVDPRGEKIHEVEQEVDWILGSGNHARTYVYRNPAGELFQIPIAWYTQDLEGNPIPGRWGMSPGYDNAFHMGLGRQVKRECMFCHNGYPDVPVGNDTAPEHVFPAELPEGTGCQRCHGPGEEHVALAFGDDLLGGDFLRDSIVNPARLPMREQNDVCYGCHMQPTVALSGIRRADRSTYSFRPGEKLADYMVHMDVEEEGRTQDERFEINHHPYRMEQSLCFTESPVGALGCLTCHDPHRKILPAERADHYRPVCLSCHTEVTDDHEHLAGQALDTVDCTSCHMPQRRPTDVPQVVMTDHKIQRTFDREAYLAPSKEIHPPVTDIVLLDPESVPNKASREVYRALASIKAGGTSEAHEWLIRHLPKSGIDDLIPQLTLAGALQQDGEYAAVRDQMLALAETHPESGSIFELLGVAQASLGDHAAAKQSFYRFIQLSPQNPVAHFNAAHTELGTNNVAGGLIGMERAVRLRPNMAVAWLYLGVAYQAIGRDAEALDAFERSMAIDPRTARPYLEAGRLLQAMQRADDARNLWRHGTRVVRDPSSLEAALAELGPAPTQATDASP